MKIGSTAAAWPALRSLQAKSLSYNPQRARGVALLVTLVFIVMITLLIVGLTVSMRIDRPAADTYFEKMRATQLAQGGVEELMATLQQYSAATSGNSTSNWISQ